MTELKIQKIGAAVGVVLPQDMLAAMGVREGDTVHASISTEGVVTLAASDPAIGRQVGMARNLGRRYRNALRELAK